MRSTSGLVLNHFISTVMFWGETQDPNEHPKKKILEEQVGAVGGEDKEAEEESKAHTD